VVVEIVCGGGGGCFFFCVCVFWAPFRWVMSDWTATHSTVQAANAGLDQEMPFGLFFSPLALDVALATGQITMATLDDKVVRILTAMFQIGLFDRAPSGNINANVTSVAHNQLARSLASSGMVLMQNTRATLPLTSSQPLRIVIVGDWAASPVVAGDGSGHVDAPYIISPLLGVSVRAPAGSTVMWFPTANTTQAVAAAAAADVAIAVTGTTASEGFDRASLALPSQDDALIEAVANAQVNTIVVVVAPGAVLMPWAQSVQGAIVLTFFPGQEFGNALADVLWGDVNPSGRLPLTMPNQENEIQFTQAQYPGLPALNPTSADYSEKLLIGHRWYDANGVVPAFAFGHGLSYTTFQYANLRITTSRYIDDGSSNKFSGGDSGGHTPRHCVSTDVYIFSDVCLRERVFDYPVTHRWSSTCCLNCPTLAQERVQTFHNCISHSQTVRVVRHGS
jgi:beta-glucosidase